MRRWACICPGRVFRGLLVVGMLGIIRLFGRCIIFWCLVVVVVLFVLVSYVVSLYFVVLCCVCCVGGPFAGSQWDFLPGGRQSFLRFVSSFLRVRF